MHQVEGTPLLGLKRKIKGVAGPELDQVGFAGRRGLSSGLFELAGVALDSDHSTGGPGGLLPYCRNRQRQVNELYFSILQNPTLLLRFSAVSARE